MANHFDLQEQEQLDQLKHFWSTWGTLISFVLIAVAGSLLAWNGYQYWQSRQANQAAALLDAVEVAARTGDQPRLQQAFADIKSNYAGTPQASQAGLSVAKNLIDKGDAAGAKEALAWVASQSKDEGLKSVARMRLASVLMDEKNYADALQQLAGVTSVEFEGAFADRRGDVYLLQGKRAEAIAEYTKAYKSWEENVEYRRLVQVKLEALGASPQTAVTVASSSPDVVN